MILAVEIIWTHLISFNILLLLEVPAYFSPEECEYLIMLAKRAGLDRSPLHPTSFNLPDITTEELFHEWDVDKDNRLSPIEVQK